MSIPIRMCIVCRNMKPKNELVRIVKGIDKKLFVDKTFKAQGRGAYICLEKECNEKLIKTRALERAFKAAIPADVLETIMKELI